MTIINLYDANKNFEEIKLSPKKTFKFKNEYMTDINGLFANVSIDDLNAIPTINNYPNSGDTTSGLISLFSWRTKNLKENYGTTQNANTFKLKNDSINTVFTNPPPLLSQSRPISLDNLQISARNIELNSNYFGVKRLQQNLTPFSEVLNKKKIIKNNLYKSSSNKSDSFFSQQFNYSFYNYNCFNFFNIYPSQKIINDTEHAPKNSLINNSHKNMLVYSNCQISDANNLNNFISLNKIKKSISINFWINPKRKAYSNKKYNPGCILHIPNIISIYLVGTSNDDEFKIYCLFHDDSNKFVGNPAISKQLLSDSILTLNTWNNVSVVINNNNFFNVKLKINDEVYKEFTLQTPILNSNLKQTPIITIGNRINDESDNFWGNSNYTLIQKQFFNDNNYLDYHLNEDEIISGNVIPLSIDLNTSIFDKNIVIDQSNYNTQSHALNAELYGLAIFNDNLSFTKLSKYAIGEKDDNKVEMLANEYLCFYLPCIYLSEQVKRKGYITLGTRDDIAYRSVVNPYFSHKIYGHELSIEGFVRDIINLRLPYIYNMTGDEYPNAFTTLTNPQSPNALTNNQDKLNKFKIVRDFSVYNKNPSQILNQIMTSGLFFRDFNFTKGLNKFQYNNLIYRNNFILPCDNGKSRFDLNSIFNLSTIKNLLDDSVKNFYINENPHYINISNLYNSQDEYSWLINNSNFFEADVVFQKIKNENPYQISTNNIITWPDPSINNSNYLTKLLIDKNDINYIQKNIFQTIKNANEDFVAINIINNQNIFDKLKTDNNQTLMINSIFKNIDQNYEASITSIENVTFTTKGSRNYTNYFNSHYAIEGDLAETYSVLFEISNILYSAKLRKNKIEIQDFDLSGTGGALNIKVKDNGKSLMYRADCDGIHATWAHIGHAFYADGLVNILHPGLSNFGENNFVFNLQGEHSLFTNQIDIPVNQGEFNLSNNKTYINGLKPSLNLSDLESTHFVYITGVNLHDENMNIVAKANFAQPIVKRTNDRYNIRLKMDF